MEPRKRHSTEEQPGEATEPMGSAGHETESDQPSEMGSAGVYATPVHEEGEDAIEAGKRS